MTRFVELHSDSPLAFDSRSDVSADEKVRGRVFAVSANFIALVSIGPILPGHSLICPRVPSPCLGDILSDAHMETEFFEFLTDTGGLLKRAFGNDLLYFEHGGSSSLRPVGSSVTHSCLHIIPGISSGIFNRLFESENAVVKKQDFGWEPVKGIQSTIYPAATWQEYLFIGCDRASWLARITNDQMVPPQYLRQVVGEASGNPKWDWRKWPNEDNIIEKTIKRISGELASRNAKPIAHVSPIFSSPFSLVELD